MSFCFSKILLKLKQETSYHKGGKKNILFQSMSYHVYSITGTDDPFIYEASGVDVFSGTIYPTVEREVFLRFDTSRQTAFSGFRINYYFNQTTLSRFEF